MSSETCVLTTRDFTILELMRERCHSGDDPLMPVLKRKLETASVVFRPDVPAHVATLNSRITFTVDGGGADTRALVRDGATEAPIGTFLPITTLRGLALLGLAEGQDVVIFNGRGIEERLLLEKVDYQPEAAERQRKLATVGAIPAAYGT